jgi:hypothetical protein
VAGRAGRSIKKFRRRWKMWAKCEAAEKVAIRNGQVFRDWKLDTSKRG